MAVPPVFVAHLGFIACFKGRQFLRPLLRLRGALWLDFIQAKCFFYEGRQMNPLGWLLGRLGLSVWRGFLWTIGWGYRCGRGLVGLWFWLWDRDRRLR